jgi:hypothetical protein
MKIRISGKVVAMVMVLTGKAASGAVLQMDDFTTDTENWATRDSELAVLQSGISGGVLVGDFDPAAPGDVVTDAFRLSSFMAFPGYILTAFSFQFYSVNVLPSDLVFRFGNGSTTFFRSLSLGSIGGWTSHTLALDNQTGWLGGAPSSFTSVLAAATFYDIQVTQNGTNSQTYFMDNFQIMGEEPGYAGSPAAVPEPGTLNFLVLALAAAAARHWKKRRSIAPMITLLVSIIITGRVYAESFDSDVAGWSAGSSSSMEVTHRADGPFAGTLGGKFSAQQIAYPQTGSFVAPESFITNQFGAIAELRQAMLGFDFLAESVEPVSFCVRIGDGTGRQVSRFLGAFVREPGRWHSFRLSLVSASIGKWDGAVEQFDQLLNEITTLSIDISRNGEALQSYRIDNVFVDYLPDLGLDSVTGAEPQVTWRNLRAGEFYRIEESTCLNPAIWNEVVSFTATGSVHKTPYIATNMFKYFRLVMP